MNVSSEILQKNGSDGKHPLLLGAQDPPGARPAHEEQGAAVRDVLERVRGRVLKEGILQDFEHKDQLLELIRYKSSAGPQAWTSLAEYRDRMQKDQKAIYYITGGKEAGLRSSPLLETYKARGIEVLIMDDEIDEIVAGSIGKFMEVELKAVNRPPPPRTI